MDVDNILEWVRQNPMGTEFMLLELIKSLGVNAEINNGLIFVKVKNPQDDKYLSILVTNRNGDDIVSINNVLINKDAKLSFIAVKRDNSISYSLLSDNENPRILDIPEVSLLNDGDYLVYSDSVLMSNLSGDEPLTYSEINDTIEPELKTTRKRKSK